MLPEPQIVNRPDHRNVMLLDMQAMPMFERMQHNGMLFDVSKASEIAEAISEEKHTSEERMRHVLGPDLFDGFNPGSEQQIAHLLFTQLKLPNHDIKLTRSKERESVAKGELAKLVGAHPVIAPLQHWRECDTLEDTFVSKLPRMVRDDGRIHPQVLYTRTATGRPASKEPNLLNIPVRTKLGKRIRDAFVAPPECCLVSGDLSQIELRELAHESQDKAMLEVYRTGGDIHESTRQRVFGDPPNEAVKEKQRKRAKNLNFGIVFGITAVGYREQLIIEGESPDDWPEERCQKDIDGMWEAYPGTKDRIDGYARRIRRYGYTWDMWGRYRPMPHVRSVHPWIREAALREGQNHPIQAGAAGIMKRGMADVHPASESYNAEPGWVCRPLLQIYDQLLFEVSTEIAEEFSELLGDLMKYAVKLSVPIEVDVSIGDNWGEV